MSGDAEATERYEALAARLVAAQAGVARGTMMGYPCLRWEGRFFASLGRGGGRLIVKLPADRVAELVAAGTGDAFAPNSRVFREWVALPDAVDWDAYADEALQFSMEASEGA